MLDSRERVGQFIDRVVRPRQRAVAARIGRGQHEIAIEFFGGVHFHHHWFAVIGEDAAAIVVEHELGIDQFAMVFDQPVDSVRRAALFIGRHREDDVAVGNVSFFLHADQAWPT